MARAAVRPAAPVRLGRGSEPLCLISSQEKGLEIGFRKHGRVSGNTTAGPVADMFTKQIFPKHFERLRRVMMGHENFDDMCERYQDAKAAGDNVDDPKLCTAKPVRSPNG